MRKILFFAVILLMASFCRVEAQSFERFKMEEKVDEHSKKVYWILKPTFVKEPEVKSRTGSCLNLYDVNLQFQEQFRGIFSQLPEEIRNKIPRGVFADIRIDVKGCVCYVSFRCLEMSPTVLTNEDWMRLYNAFRAVKIDGLECTDDFNWVALSYLLGSRQKANKEKKP